MTSRPPDSQPPAPPRPRRPRRSPAPLRPPPPAWLEKAENALREARSGPAVARLFHRLFALIFAIAWLSLGSQIDVLVGSRGLLPAAPFMRAMESQQTSFLDAPSFLRWTSGSDTALHLGIAAGFALTLFALAGIRARLCLGVSTFLYLGYAVACRSFLTFQWDNLLLECGLLATLLPEDRPADLVHLLFRILLLKLYGESGLAKWQSPLHDWQDGSAMTFYYETAPIPARLAHTFHALPEAWHHLESWFTLFFELAIPPLIFAPRRYRFAAAAIFTAFQIINIATANYGFFSYLALALHVFLLRDGDLRAARRFIEHRLPRLARLRVRARWLRLRLHGRSPTVRLERQIQSLVPAPRRRALSTWTVRAFAFAYVGISLLEGIAYFGGVPEVLDPFAGARAVYGPLRVVNNYHLFAAITRERVEPEVQTRNEGQADFVAHDLAHKPGEVHRAPHLVAPHQPRVDFLLWFYGLSYRRGTPAYVAALLDRVCHDPGAVRALFPGGLPDHPEAARIAFFRYHFTTPEERAATGAFWRREPLGATPELRCR